MASLAPGHVGARWAYFYNAALGMVFLVAAVIAPAADYAHAAPALAGVAAVLVGGVVRPVAAGWRAEHGAGLTQREERAQKQEQKSKHKGQGKNKQFGKIDAKNYV